MFCLRAEYQDFASFLFFECRSEEFLIGCTLLGQNILARFVGIEFHCNDATTKTAMVVGQRQKEIQRRCMVTNTMVFFFEQ